MDYYIIISKRIFRKIKNDTFLLLYIADYRFGYYLKIVEKTWFVWSDLSMGEGSRLVDMSQLDILHHVDESKRIEAVIPAAISWLIACYK